MTDDVVARLAAQVQDLSTDVLSQFERVLAKPAPSPAEDPFKEIYTRVLQHGAITAAELDELMREYYAEKKANEVQKLSDRLSALP